MKELHNHIFSNTTCISKETMLRYINKQLSKNELYKVEKHMLDCELCSDAYDGMQFAQNSSMLFAIDSQIDQRVRMGNSKAPIMRNLMVAASVIVIIFGAYFTINYFNKTIDNDLGLAIQTNDNLKLEKEAAKTKEAKEPDGNANAQKNAAISGKDNMLLEDNEESESVQQGDKYIVVVDELSSVVEEQTIEADNIGFVAEMEEDNGIVAGEIAKNLNESTGESEKQLETLSKETVAGSKDRRSDNLTSTSQDVPNSVTTENAAFGYTRADEDKAGLPSKKSKNKARSSKGKKRYKSANPTKAYFSDGSLEEFADFKAEKPKSKIITINSYKVVDYTEEYQKEYDLKNANTIETTSISADFESKEDAAIAEKERAETIVEISYKETLEKAIKLYKNQKYNEAIAQFDIILATHPEEVNGLFYGGLSNYHLQRYNNANKKLDKVLNNKVTEFNEEANWYKALTLIELKQTDKAKKLLKEIVASKGFYKTKAEEKLKGL